MRGVLSVGIKDLTYLLWRLDQGVQSDGGDITTNIGVMCRVNYILKSPMTMLIWIFLKRFWRKKGQEIDVVYG